MKKYLTSKKIIAGGCIVAAIAAPAAHGALITLNNNDGIDASSFNSAGNWSNGEAPSAGNDYSVDNGLRLRTPANGDDHTFAGNSLTLGPNGLSGYNVPGGELMYKGWGTSAVVTINNLVMNGGSIAHANGIGDHFNLAGNVEIAADSVIYPKQGRINLTASLSGSATLTVPRTDGQSAGRSLYIFSGANTFTGDLVVETGSARVDLMDGANLNFVIGASGVNNSVSGGGVANFDGVFLFDLSGASSNVGDSWTIASVANQTFGGTFSVSGFDSTGGGLWTSGIYQFDQSTGVLEVIPEPSTYAILFGGLALAGVFMGRRMRVA